MDVNYKVHTADGRLVRAGSNSQATFSIDLTDQKSGVYLITLAGDQLNEAIRIIKQ
ncbi:MAG: hypothetical protein DCO96_01160 [Fluviicola sp. XM-24bin1]|nr:MAG: hypothetical protein DCO96_01160 [Fluviicola sp. XM-24bin1]